MKQTFKKPSYYLLSQAMDGDEKAIEKILAFYDPYISKCCLRPLYDEYGNVYIVVDMSSRLSTLLTLFNCLERTPEGVEEQDVFQVNFDYTDMVLEQERKRFKNFLDRI